MGRKRTAEALTRTGNPFRWATHGRNPTEVVITTDTGVRARSLRLIAGGSWLLASFLVAVSVPSLVLVDRHSASPLEMAWPATTAHDTAGSATYDGIRIWRVRTAPRGCRLRRAVRVNRR